MVAAFSACTADDDMLLSPDQQEMIGQGIDFCTSIAEPFVTRATYQHNGSFNEGDQMRIFRQYANAAESFKDHSRFLQRPRYASCFEIVVEDYEGWA